MKLSIILIIICFVGQDAISQSIRKNFQEMTQSERDELVNAFYQLRNGADLVDDLANFHNANFNSIHFNLPNSPQNDVFLAWHRRQIFELEQAMQNINGSLSIPFWDWTMDNTTNSPLWDNDFLGQFNSDWSLNRNLGGAGQLPSTSDVNSVQSITDWLTYSNTLERGVVHAGPHVWTGGIMSGGASPRDPVFYLHHGMIDKLWQEWEDANGSSSFQKTSLPRYDGTYTFDGQTLPSVNPNDIIDSKILGVFYADNQQAILEDYTVNNTYRSLENFYYQYKIEAGSNFIIPTGKNAKIESVNEILLKPGFHSQNGSSLSVKIDTDNNVNTSARSVKTTTYNNQKPFKKTDIKHNVYNQQVNLPLDEKYSIFPNPFFDELTILFDVKSGNNCSIEIFDLKGVKLYNKILTENQIHMINDIELKKGLYILKILENDNLIVIQKIYKY